QGWPLRNASDLDQVHAYRVFADDNTKVLGFEDLKLAFLCFEEKLVFVEALKDALHDLSVLVDEPPGSIDGDFAFSNQVTEYVIHHPLECGGRIRKPKEHDCWFKQSSVHAEGGLLLISFPDPDIVVSPTNIELCE
ncbi:hypothetical protein ARMGADRAFT_882521, partial [Armillaria gallica]